MRRENVEFSGEPCRDHLKTKLQVQVNIQDFIFNYQSIWFPESTLQLWKVHYKWEKNVQNDLVTWKLLARCSSCIYFIYKLSIISRNIHRANKFIDTNPETELGRNSDWTSAKLLFYSLHLIYTQEFKMNIEEVSVVHSTPTAQPRICKAIITMSSNQTKKTPTLVDIGPGPQNLEARHKNKPRAILPHDPQRSTFSFPLFNNPPSEHRLNIWIYVAHYPSIIKNSTKGTGLTFYTICIYLIRLTLRCLWPIVSIDICFGSTY